MNQQQEEQLTLTIDEGAIGIRHAACPKGCSLMDPAVPIHGLPSIHLRYRSGGREGHIHLDPLYGKFDNVLDLKIEPGATADFLCPGCGCSLRSEQDTCHACSAPLFTLTLPSGIVEGCLRNGCHYHRLSILNMGDLMGRLFQDRLLDLYL